MAQGDRQIFHLGLSLDLFILSPLVATHGRSRCLTFSSAALDQ